MALRQSQTSRLTTDEGLSPELPFDTPCRNCTSSPDEVGHFPELYAADRIFDLR
jgi:hypothetical protein